MRMKKSTEQGDTFQNNIIFTSLYKLILEKKIWPNDKKCKFTLFCWEISPTKLKYLYLGLYTKFDHFAWKKDHLDQ